MTLEIRHRSRTGTTRGPQVMPPADVAADPDMQQTILRLGLNVSDVNAASVDRCAYVVQVASVVRQARRRGR